jgi:hypothetical protein
MCKYIRISSCTILIYCTTLKSHKSRIRNDLLISAHTYHSFGMTVCHAFGSTTTCSIDILFNPHGPLLMYVDYGKYPRSCLSFGKIWWLQLFDVGGGMCKLVHLGRSLAFSFRTKRLADGYNYLMMVVVCVNLFCDEHTFLS